MSVDQLKTLANDLNKNLKDNNIILPSKGSPQEIANNLSLKIHDLLNNESTQHNFFESRRWSWINYLSMIHATARILLLSTDFFFIYIQKERAKSIIIKGHNCPSDGMVDMRDSNPLALQRAGSSPVSGTISILLTN